MYGARAICLTPPARGARRRRETNCSGTVQPGRTKSQADEDRGGSASADALIAAINAQLARSVRKRAGIALRIGAWKQLHNLPAADTRREREQLARIFRTLFRESRALVVKARKAAKR
ncbi:MAG: chorismate mutase [Planctomycetes bacterium]|nr:chorismate mutase [Planctomycetota bacterium]